MSTRRKRRADFIERTLHSLTRALRHALDAETTARKTGLLQSLDPRVKVVGLPALLIAAAQARNFWVIAALFALALALAMASGISLRELAQREWIGVALFTGALVAPALFITPGRVLWRAPILGWTVSFQGLQSASLLLARVETCATLALLLVLCTSWPHVLKALRVLRAPVVLVVILGMTHRYIFVLLQSAEEMWDARRARRVGVLAGAQQRRLAAGAAGALLDKSVHLSSEVYLAMQARGFRGQTRSLDEFAMHPRDWIALSLFAAASALALWLGNR